MASLSACSLSPSALFCAEPRRVSSSPLTHKLLRGRICRAELSQDAPLATAIGACILSSLVLPVAKRVDDDEEEEENSAIVSTDMRLAAMGIISFIPYFNWLSWVFAWLDSGKTRYAIYALVYLLPYLSSNLSISPQDTWFPISSILLGILHVQLEASIANGDVHTLHFFTRNFSSKEKHTDDQS